LKDSGYRCHKRSENSGEYGESLGTNTPYVDDKAVAKGPMRSQAGKFALAGEGLSRTETHTRPNRKGRISAALLVELQGIEPDTQIAVTCGER
jgi:hypothetical protein